jgi:hypothetical protein
MLLVDERCLQPDLLVLIGLFRSRASLQAEILMIRYQLNVLRRESPQRSDLQQHRPFGIRRVLLVGTRRAGRFEDRQAGDGDPLALWRLPSVLARKSNKTEGSMPQQIRRARAMI